MSSCSVKNSTQTPASAGYGGTVVPVVDVIVHYNQGLGNGAEGGDPGKSCPRGSSNDELGRKPGSSCGKKSTDKPTVTKDPDVIAAAGYGGTLTSAGYGGTVVPVVDVIVHYNQGLGNGAEGGDPGKSCPRGSSNDELGRKPGSNFGKNSNDKLTGTKRNDTLVGNCGFQGYSTGKACDKKTLGSDPITNFMPGANKSGLGKPAFGTSRNCANEGFGKASGFPGGTKSAEFGRPCTPIAGGIEPKGVFYNPNSCGIGLGTGAKSAIMPHMVCGMPLSSSNFVIHA